MSSVAQERGPAARLAESSATERLRDLGVVAMLVVLAIYLSLASNVFLTSDNLLSLLEQSAPLAMIAMGGTYVVIAGGLDLSSGAILSMAGIVAAEVAINTESILLAFLAGVLAGALLGVVNGVIVAYGQINAIVATLATGIVLVGLALFVSDGIFVRVEDPAFQSLGRDELLGVKVSVWLLAACFAVLSFVLGRTRFGRYVYAVGGNAEAARLSGVPLNGVRVGAFAVSGVAAGLAGIVLASRVGSGQAEAASGIEITAIVAIIIGGTSVLGGRGAVWRTAVGVLLLALLGNGFNLLNVEAEYQRMVQGLVLLLAIGADVWTRKAARH